MFDGVAWRWVFGASLHEWNVLANTFNFTGLRNYEQLLSDQPARVLLASALFSGGLVVEPEPGRCWRSC